MISWSWQKLHSDSFSLKSKSRISGSSDLSEEAPDDRKYKKSLETDETTEVERKSDVSDESDETVDDMMDDKSEKIVRIPLKLLSIETIEENLSPIEIIPWIDLVNSVYT